MSVPVWRRSESHTEFLWQLFLLNKDIAEIVANKPKKYKSTHSDLLIKQSLEALSKANIGNEIYVNDEFDLKRRVALFGESKALVYNVALLGDIFLELCKKSTGCDETKCAKQQERIGDRCAICIKLLTGTIKADKKRYKSK